MAILVLIPDDPAEQARAYEYVTQLGDAEYTISITYRERQDRWYLRLSDADGVVLISDLRLTVGYSLLFRYRKPGMPDGALVLIDREDTGAECGFEDLGRRCGLLWADDDDLPVPESPDLQTVIITP